MGWKAAALHRNRNNRLEAWLYTKGILQCHHDAVKLQKHTIEIHFCLAIHFDTCSPRVNFNFLYLQTLYHNWHLRLCMSMLMVIRARLIVTYWKCCALVGILWQYITWVGLRYNLFNSNDGGLEFGQCFHFDLNIFKVDIEINGLFLLPDKPAEVLHSEVSGTEVTIRGIRTVPQFIDMALWHCLLLVESCYVTRLFMIMFIIPEASRLYLVDRKLLFDPVLIWLLSITEFWM